MPSFPTPAVTLLYAAAAALINIWLAFRTVRARRSTNTLIGHGEADGLLYARGRAQANFIEYVPLTLILMLVVELRIGPAIGLWATGALLIVGRLLHPFGMERPGVSPLRSIGIAATWMATLILAFWALWIALHG